MTSHRRRSGRHHRHGWNALYHTIRLNWGALRDTLNSHPATQWVVLFALFLITG